MHATVEKPKIRPYSKLKIQLFCRFYSLFSGNFAQFWAILGPKNEKLIFGPKMACNWAKMPQKSNTDNGAPFSDSGACTCPRVTRCMHFYTKPIVRHEKWAVSYISACT